MLREVDVHACINQNVGEHLQYNHHTYYLSLVLSGLKKHPPARSCRDCSTCLYFCAPSIHCRSLFHCFWSSPYLRTASTTTLNPPDLCSQIKTFNSFLVSLQPSAYSSFLSLRRINTSSYNTAVFFDIFTT